MDASDLPDIHHTQAKLQSTWKDFAESSFIFWLLWSECVKQLQPVCCASVKEGASSSTRDGGAITGASSAALCPSGEPAFYTRSITRPR